LNLREFDRIVNFKQKFTKITCNQEKLSLILSTTNSKTGFFGIFSKEERKFVTFKTGILDFPIIEVTRKVKLLR